MYKQDGDRKYSRHNGASLSIIYLIIVLFIISAIPIQAAAVVSTSPTQNQLNVPVSDDVSVTFDEDMDEPTLNNSTILIHANMTGLHPGTITYDSPSRTATTNPDSDFMVGEIVTVILTTGIESTGGVPLANSYSWSFTIAVSASSTGQFYRGGSCEGYHRTTCVTGADFDNDGDLDLVSTSTYGVCYMYINDGSGSFDRTTYDYTDARCVVAADFDNDGDIDLAFGPSNSSGIFSWENDGGLVFTQNWQSEFLGEDFLDIIASDFNGDGYLDIATCDEEYDSVFILLGNGDVSFTRDTSFAAGRNPITICAADFDSDGDADLVVTNAWSDDIMLFLNQGDGSFGPAQDYPVGDTPHEAVAADLDGDGDLDLSVANDYLDRSVSILLNYGDGNFAPQVKYNIDARPWAETAADVNGDGDIDLLLPNRNPSILTYLHNDGSAVYDSVSQRLFDGEPEDIFAGDIDSDGDIDLVTSYRIAVDNPSLRFFINGECQDTDDDGYGDPGVPTNQCPDDNCPLVHNIDQADTDADGLGDACDDDIDDDGVLNEDDNCPYSYNPDQIDSNGNGYGDACELGPNSVDVDLALSADYTQEHDTLYLGGAYQFRVWIANDFRVSGMSLGFRITSDDGVTWQWESRPDGRGSLQAVTVYPGSRLGYPEGSAFDMTHLLATEVDVDGVSPDTLMAGGVAMMVGLATGPSEPMYGMHFSVVDMPGDVGEICIDSTFIPPSGAFMFDGGKSPYAIPDFRGPFCWPVKRAPILGDFDLDGQITVGDVVEMIAVIFLGRPHPVPVPAGDVNCDEQFNVGDAIYLINYIFRFGPAPGCP